MCYNRILDVTQGLPHEMDLQRKIIHILKFSFHNDILLCTVFPPIRPAGIIFLLDLQLRVLLEITKFHLHKRVPGAGIIRNAGIIRGRDLYEEIR